MYRPPPRLLILGVALAALIALAAACSDDDPAGSTTDPAATQRAFLVAMVPHHESAIAMARVALSRSQTPEIVALAERITAEQRPEIAEMRDIHRRLFGEELIADEAAHEVLGLSAEEAGFGHGDVAGVLRDAPDIDAAFLEEMVGHHRGAVAMAEAALADADDPELRALAQSIVTTQEDEIELMAMLAADGPSSAPAGVGGGDGDNPAAEHDPGHAE